jgi:hypothetical protein
MRKLAVGLLLLAALAADAATFRPDPIRAHMKFLASDLLEGRATGTRGYQLAAEYVASQFEASGVEPGANGSYLQPITFRHTVASPESAVTFTTDSGSVTRLQFGKDFMTYGDALNSERVSEGRVVFVRYGVTAPDLKYDDYAGVDVRGKIVAYFAGAPATFTGALRAHYSSSSGKLDNAAAHGAAGVLALNTREDFVRFTWDRVLSHYKLGSMHWLDASGAPHAVQPAVSNSVSLSMEGQERLFASIGRTVDQIAADLASGKVRSMELPVRASMRIVSSHKPVESANVVGVVRGSDPVLRDQYLVYSSHLDHLGITDPVDGDSINNGAMDNASGIAAMLEIARAFAEMPTKPRRSILFVATTAEEKGLRGADYFANNPTVPIDQLVANINIDQIMMMHAVKDVIPLGVEVSDLGAAALKVAKDMGLEVSPDPAPEEVYFVRSDQYPFVKRGVPAIYVGMGNKAVDPAIDSLREQTHWVRTRYHSPKDDLEQPLDYSVPATLARYNYLLGLEVANRTQPPKWTPGNFFGQKFGRK